MHSSRTTSTSKRPPKNTGKSSTSHRSRPHRTLTSGHGPHTNPRPMSWTCMATQSTTQHKHGRTGCPAQNNTYYKNTPGLRKEEDPTSGQVTSLWRQSPPSPRGKGADQLTGNNYGPGSSLHSNSLPSRFEDPPRASCKQLLMHPNTGLARRHGASSSTPVTTGTNTKTVMRPTWSTTPSTINFN